MIVKQSDLDAIKNRTTITTLQDLEKQKKIAEQQKEIQQAQAKARKAKMISLDKERSTKLPPTEFQKEQAIADKNLLERAQFKIDEEMDQVKSMNKMVFYSKVVTIRDKQLEEMKEREEERIKEQKKLDLIMEIERLKVCQEQEDREVKKKQAQKMGAQIITN